jgi:hypothetical protein
VPTSSLPARRTASASRSLSSGRPLRAGPVGLSPSFASFSCYVVVAHKAGRRPCGGRCQYLLAFSVLWRCSAPARRHKMISSSGALTSLEVQQIAGSQPLLNALRRSAAKPPFASRMRNTFRRRGRILALFAGVARQTAERVGWVERSKTHRSALWLDDGFREGSTHPTNCGPAQALEGRTVSYRRSRASMLRMVGRCRAISFQRSPSSRLANTEPLLVPKYTPAGSRSSRAMACRRTVK